LVAGEVVVNEILKQLLEVRLALEKARSLADDYGVLDGLPEFAKMQKLERSAFKKVNEWSKP
jgi:hypothetical protein